MAYTDDYVKTNWVNKPSTNTPINQTNLNHLEQGVKNNCGRVANLSTTKAEQSDLLSTFKGVAFDSTTGTFTFTKWDGTSVTVNTDLEKIAVNFDYDDDPSSAHYQNLVITLDDGTVKYVDMSALITQYEFTSTTTIAFTVGADGKVSANIPDGSITGNKLQPNYLADCQQAKTNAETAAGAAETDALDAEAWANGTRGGVPIPPTDPAYQKYSKWWAEHGANSLAGLTDVNITSLQDGDTLVYDSATQKWINVAAGPTPVTVTLTLNGAKNDVITVKDSNNQTVGTCTFAAGQTSGTVQIDVPVGGGNFKFVSAIAKGITEETKNDDYEKAVSLSDAVSQTVNVYPKKALYWYGNKINVTTFWGNNSDNIQRNTTPPDGSITENTNNIVCTGGVRRRGICSSTTVTGTTLKAFVTTSNVVGDGTVKLSENANDTTLTTRVDIASINTPQTDYIVSGSITSGNYALLSQYNVDLTIKALWCDDGHEDDIDIHGTKEDVITIKDSDNQIVAACVFESGQTVGYVSKALLPSGTYTFTSSVAKDTTDGTSDYSKTIVLDGSETEVNVYPDGLMIYWYGNVVNGGAWSQGRTSGYFGFDNATNYMRVYKNSATLGGVGETIATANTINFSGYSKLKATGKAYRTTPPSGYSILEYAFVGFYSTRDLGPGDAGNAANSISFSSIPANTVETREVSITTPTSGYCYSTDNFPEAGIYLYALWAEI